MTTSGPWDDWRSAELYREYLERSSIYRGLNERLAELADLETAKRVLDLGCGTGATVAACLERLPAGAEILGIDASEAMVGVARTWVEDPRARFCVAPADRLVTAVDGSFDRVVSNAAFWHFARRGRVLDQIASRLEEGGLLVFNLPEQRMAGGTANADPFQVALGRAVERRSGRGAAIRLFEPTRIQGALERRGLELERTVRFVHRGTQAELVDLMRLPTMAGRLAPGLDLEAGLAAVEQAARVSDPGRPVEIPWIYFVARRVEPGTEVP